MELGSSGGALQACRRGGMEVGSLRGALQACRRGGMEIGSLRGELWSSGGILQACRREILMGFARPPHGEPCDSVAKRRPTQRRMELWSSGRVLQVEGRGGGREV